MNSEKWIGYHRNKVVQPHNKKRGSIKPTALVKTSLVGTPLSKRGTIELVEFELMKVIQDNILHQAHKNFKNYMGNFATEK